MDAARYLRARVDPGPRAAALAAGDAAAIVSFAAIGAAHHGVAPLSNPAHVGRVAAPFLLGWAVAALLGGLYTRDATATPRRALSWSLPAWIVATLVGQALRATAAFPGDAAVTFVLVTVVFGGALVVGWRMLVALFE